jgi:hypothetical protein
MATLPFFFSLSIKYEIKITTKENKMFYVRKMAYVNKMKMRYRSRLIIKHVFFVLKSFQSHIDKTCNFKQFDNSIK